MGGTAAQEANGTAGAGPRLPARLEAVLRQVLPGRMTADVGTGHGLLPLALVRRGITPRVIATEARPGPLAEAERHLREVADRVAVRAGWGLTPLAPGEAEVLVVAGLGGETIRAILDRGWAVAAAAERLILQPQKRADAVRRWLLAHGFALVTEDLVWERGRFYPVIVAAPAEAGPPPEGVERCLAELVRGRGLPPMPASLLLELGPLLVAERHPVLTEQVVARLQAAREVAGRLSAGGSSRAAARRRELREAIERLEMVNAWLHPSVPSSV